MNIVVNPECPLRVGSSRSQESYQLLILGDCYRPVAVINAKGQARRVAPSPAPLCSLLPMAWELVRLVWCAVMPFATAMPS